MVMFAVESTALCELSTWATPLDIEGINPYPNPFACDETANILRQIQGAYALQDYIERLDGDPENNSGWYRIAKTASDAREIINAGKLAVVLG
jgi:hypothetical protein